ncbi:hypothetical protein BR93DRAFT_462710 [Coniochaeta sp. PMI_546]|nr:hypothetical protein BR93DRAFT_462710 [Coniochaeta sp. PMI_546]
MSSNLCTIANRKVTASNKAILVAISVGYNDATNSVRVAVLGWHHRSFPANFQGRDGDTNLQLSALTVCDAHGLAKVLSGQLSKGANCCQTCRRCVRKGCFLAAGRRKQTARSIARCGSGAKTVKYLQRCRCCDKSLTIDHIGREVNLMHD